MSNQHDTTSHTLRIIADNLDELGDREELHDHQKYLHLLRNNARFLRDTANTIIQKEFHMGRVADDLKKAETQRDAARTERDAAIADKARLQAQLDAQKPNLLDGEDLAALDKFEADEATPPAPTPEPTPEPTPAP